MSFLSAHNRLEVARIIRVRARQFHIKIHHYENVGNHLHVVASFPMRELFQDFLRTVTALISRFVTGSKKGKPFGKRFWDGLAFTRVVMGHRDFRGLANYLLKNALERDLGKLSRTTVEEFEAAQRKARRQGVDVWAILDSAVRVT
jgi:hypothetical protein